MNTWMAIAGALLLLCAVLAGVCARLAAKLRAGALEHADDAESLRRELYALRAEKLRQNRDFAAMRRALEDEQARCDDLDQALREREYRLADALRRAERAEEGRIRAERDVAAGEMRTRLLEREADGLRAAQARFRDEQDAQERLYQDIIRERDAQIKRLQESARRRPRRQSDVLRDQMSIDDILKE